MRQCIIDVSRHQSRRRCLGDIRRRPTATPGDPSERVFRFFRAYTDDATSIIMYARRQTPRSVDLGAIYFHYRYTVPPMFDARNALNNAPS